MKRANTTLLIAGFLVMTSVSFAQTTTNKSTPTADAATMTKEKQQSITPQQALQKLKDGNSRFVSGKTLNRDLKKQVEVTSKGQYPHSVILSCLDSRTSSELIFDQGLGDVFNARVAGNFENTDILGSLHRTMLPGGRAGRKARTGAGGLTNSLFVPI